MRDALVDITSDIRLSLRRMRRDGLVTLAAVCCIALGFAGTVTVVSLTDALWFGAPPGVRDAATVRRLYLHRTEQGVNPQTALFGFSSLRAIATALEPRVPVTGVVDQDVVVDWGHERSVASGALATANVFRVLGVPISYGRGFSDERGGAHEVVISYSLATARFGIPAAAVGRVIGVGGAPHDIVGVAYPGFHGTELRPVDVWLGVEAAGSRYLPAGWDTESEARVFRLFTRVPENQVDHAIASQAAAAYHDDTGPSLVSPEPPRILLEPLQLGRSPVPSRDAAMSRVLVILALCLWLTVCVNFGGLVLVRVMNRRHENAVSLAIGGTPGRLLRAWVTEVMIMVGLGAVVGAGLARVLDTYLAGTDLLRHIETYRSNALHMTVAALILIAVAITGAALLARREVTRVDISRHLVSSGRSLTARGGRIQATLLAFQIALSTLLFYSAGLYVQSLRHAQATDLGFDPDRLIVATARMSAAGYGTTETDQAFAAMLNRVRQLPAVQHAAVAATIPFVVNIGTHVTLPDGSTGVEVAYMNLIGPSYFATMGVRLLQGRDFSSDDRTGSVPVVILSQGLSRDLFGDGDPVGQCVVVRDPPCARVVGVVNDLLQVDLRTPVTHVYLPVAQHAGVLPARALFVRLNDARATAGLRAELSDAIPGVPVALDLMSAVVDRQLRPWRLSAVILSAFSVLALVVVGIGVFGVVAHWVSRRMRELAVRMMLGGTTAHLVALVVTRTFAPIVAGIVIGVLAGVILGRASVEQLFRTDATDLTTLLTAVAIPLCAAAVATVGPLARVVSQSPAVTLRAE